MLSFLNPKEKKYTCLGVKVQTSMSQEDFESCKEVFQKLKPKAFTNKGLDSLTSKLGFEIRDYYFFIDIEKFGKKKFKSSVSVFYRFEGSKNISEIEIEDVIKTMQTDIFYSRSAIQSLSEKYGFDVFARAEFTAYAITTMILDNSNNENRFVTLTK